MPEDFNTIAFSDVSFDSKNILAVGGTCRIHKGIWSGTEVAVKIFPFRFDKTAISDLIDEFSIAFPLKHPNIIQIFGACTDGSEPFLILELADGGSLSSFLKKNSNEISPSRVHKFLTDITAGMVYLHSRNPPVIHGDLKASNILITNYSVGIDNSRLKISDFGLSRIKSFSSSSKTKGNLSGTLRWISPERLDMGKLTEAVDIYAFAMIGYEIISGGKVPFELDGIFADIQVIYAVLSGKRPLQPPFTSIPAYDIFQWQLIQKCWDNSPEARPSFKEIAKILNERCEYFRSPLSETRNSARYANRFEELEFSTESIELRQKSNILSRYIPCDPETGKLNTFSVSISRPFNIKKNSTSSRFIRTNSESSTSDFFPCDYIDFQVSQEELDCFPVIETTKFDQSNLAPVKVSIIAKVRNKKTALVCGFIILAGIIVGVVSGIILSSSRSATYLITGCEDGKIRSTAISPF
ncbi:hypothetical protein HK096_003547 [Nowakowskiella sp. JEL0078]|nr:hypothetical protein HK096_003547 [Nowakowskiella sp. JEL0078]